ncbi:MAG: hypothetical protein HY874_01160 [Chloroflexi bacterium]|nr:hypothetical protein [Chloroflexota bacterium]
MPDETPAEGFSAEGPQSGQAEEAASITEGGYSYTVIDDESAVAPGPPKVGARPGIRIHAAVLAAAVIIPAIAAGAIAWFMAPSGGDDGRIAADVANVISAFSQGNGATASIRYEGELPAGYPNDVPGYPGAKLVSSMLQINGEDAGYLVIYDTADARATVASYFEDKLAADPWQVDAGQDNRDSTLQQFSKIDDPNIRGLVLAAESKGDKLTTIVVSVQVTAAGKDLANRAFTLGASKPLPEGFPEAVPQYPDSTVIELAFQKQPNARSFIVSFVTKDDISKVLDYYRGQLESSGLTVTDGDASQSPLADAEAVEFTDDEQTVGGQLTAGTFAEDESYTRIDLQVQTQKQ